MGGQQIEMWKWYQMKSYEMQNDERIPNMTSKFKSDNIWPSFLPPKNVEKRLNRVFCQFSMFFWTKWGSNIIKFEFWGQIWDPLIILHLLGPHLIWFSHFDFLTFHAVLNTNVGGGGSFFKCKFQWAHRDQRKKCIR